MANDKDQALKQQLAQAVLSEIIDDEVLGLGSGTTVNALIDELASIKHKIDGVVAASEETAERCRAHGITVMNLNAAGPLSLYIDGTDQCTHHGDLIKGGGGALTREKIIASASKKFICLAQSSKCVDVLGEFPVAIEVIEMARSAVARKLLQLGGEPVWREGFVTDNGNVIIDWHCKNILDPQKLEIILNNIPGIVCNGLFARRKADELWLANEFGIEKTVVR